MVTTELVRLDSLPGREHLKRAIEVAAVGNHTVVLEVRRQHRKMADVYANIMRSAFDISNVTIIEPCYCGFHGDVDRACICKPEMIMRWNRRKDISTARLNGDMFVDFGDVSFEKMTSSRKGEADERILERVEAARNRKEVSAKPSDLDSASQRLLQAAMRQLALSDSELASVLAVTASIARLDGSRDIRPAQLAEALQYRPRWS